MRVARESGIERIVAEGFDAVRAGANAILTLDGVMGRNARALGIGPVTLGA